MQFKYAIVILHFGKVEDTLVCLASIEKHLTPDLFEVVIVNNEINIDFNNVIEKEYSFSYRIINSKTNRGFAGGNNDGVYSIIDESFDVILLLNNDTVLVNSDVETSITTLLNNEEYGVLGLINYYYSNPNIIWQVGSNNNLKTFSVNTIDNLNGYEDNEIIDVDYVPGSSMLIKTEIIKSIGLFNEKYFAYWEENDFCYSVKNSIGLKVGALTNTKILHKVTKANRSKVYIYLYVRNKLYFYRSKISNVRFLYLLSKEFAIQVIKSIKYKDLFVTCYALFFAYFDFFRGKLYVGSLNQFLQKQKTK